MEFAKFVNENFGIGKGDTVYVISDMLSLAKECRNRGERIKPDDVIDELKRLVGEEGNLLFPTFNWDFCKGVMFDYNSTPSKTGSLSKAALNREEFIRTRHPLYSFAVWGRNAQDFYNIDVPNSFGKGTIFEMMDSLDAKALVIGIPALSGLTYIHHIEAMVGVPYRYEKSFTGDYKDREGNVRQASYTMYVRDLDMDPRHINGFEPLEKIMLDKGIIRQINFGECPISSMTVKDTFEPVKDDILNNDSKNMYTYNHL